jgi:hypothetical protein
LAPVADSLGAFVVVTVCFLDNGGGVDEIPFAEPAREPLTTAAGDVLVVVETTLVGPLDFGGGGGVEALKAAESAA